MRIARGYPKERKRGSEVYRAREIREWRKPGRAGARGRRTAPKKGVRQQHRRMPRKHAGRVAPSRLLFFSPSSSSSPSPSCVRGSSCFCFFAHTNSSRAARRARNARVERTNRSLVRRGRGAESQAEESSREFCSVRL